MIPPDYTDVSQESPREAVANLVMTLRDAANDIELDPETGFVDPDELREWASRLERACQQLDAERGNWEVHSLRAALTDIANRPCFAELLGEDKDDCWCPACTARVTLAKTPVGAVPPAEHQEDR